MASDLERQQALFDSYRAIDLGQTRLRLHLIEAAARQLVEKLEAATQASVGIYQIAAIHGFPYTGPQFGDELAALKALLSHS